MKLKNLPLIRKRMAILGVSAFAAAGAAHAQFTGIGTTTPTASLHVVGDTTTAGLEAFRLETVRDLQPTETATYSEVLVYDSGTGLFRREEIADLLDDNGEWVYDATTQILAPRRTDVAGGISIDGTASTVGIGFATTVSNTFTVGNFATQLGGTLAVTGDATFNSNLALTGTSSLGGIVTLGSVAQDNAPTGTTQILIQNGTGEVEYVTAEDLSELTGIWEYDDPNAPTLIRPRLYSGAVSINGSVVDIDVPTDIAGTLDVGVVVNNVTNLNGADRVLVQDDVTDPTRVQYVTVDDLISNASYWQFDATTNTLQPSDADIEDEFVVTPNNVDVVAALDVTGATTITGTVDVTGATDITGTLDVSGATALANTLEIGSVTQVTAALLDAADEILIQQAGTDLVEYVTVEDLISNASYWDLTAGVLTPATTTNGDEVAIADGSVAIGNATNSATLDVTGATTVTGNTAITGTFDVVGNSSVVGTVLLDAGADGLTVEDLVAVTTTTEDRTGNDPATDPSGPYERVLITDSEGVVRYITAADLLASSGEWVYEDLGAPGFDAADHVYVRRLGDNASGGGDDVFVDGIGNMVLDVTKAFQFTDATNQVTAAGIDATAAYTMDLGATLTVNTAVDNDVIFNDGTEPWLYYDADAGGATERGRVGINNAAPAATLHVSGNIVASNSTVTSDKRFKRDIEEFSGALATIEALRGVSYKFRTDEFPSENFDDAEHVGFIAQEVQAVIPQVVHERTDGFLTVDYGAVTPVLAEAVQELSAKVKALEAENAALKASPAIGAADVISKLEARIADLDARLDEVAGRK